MSNNDDNEYQLEFAHYLEDEEYAPQEDEDAPQKQGLAGKAIFQGIWMLITGALAYFGTQYLVDESIIRLSDFYSAGIPRDVPEIVFFIVVAMIIFIVFQLIFSFGYMIASPQGRTRAGGNAPDKKRKKRRR